jgi:hypothetical protein
MHQQVDFLGSLGTPVPRGVSQILVAPELHQDPQK